MNFMKLHRRNKNWVLIFLCHFLPSAVALTQNLVSNPGFEKCDLCGQFGNPGVELIYGSNSNNPVDWYGVTYGSSDIRPEFPYAGRNNGGFFSFGKFEYLGNVLNAPLESGAEYEVNAYFSSRTDSEFSLDEIGFCFQKGKNLYPVLEALRNLNPQCITPDGLFFPMKRYEKVSMRFVACGGEDHLIIGRFKNLSAGDTMFIGTKRSGLIYSYTLIDEVEVKLINRNPDLLPDSVFICKGAQKKIGIAQTHQNIKLNWSNGATTDSIEVPSDAGEIWLDYAYSDQCPVRREKIQIIEVETSSNPLIPSISLCAGQTIHIQADSTRLFNPKWSHGPQSFHIEISQEGMYILQADSECGTIRDTLRVLALDSINGPLFADDKICWTMDLQIGPESNPSASYLWNTGEKISVIKPLSAGLYILEVTGLCNKLTDTIELLQDIELDSLISFPNIFTPNGDQQNDVFKPMILRPEDSGIQKYTFRIFNRWGSQLFETSDMKAAWVPDDQHGMESYIYFLELERSGCQGFRREKKTGIFSLIR